jgi:hypothetical protein
MLGLRSSAERKKLRDVKIVLREKERELAILKKQVEALKVAAALLEEPRHFEPGNAMPISEE